MTSTILRSMELSTPTEQPTRQAIAVVDRSAPGKVTGRLKQALDRMVWEGSRRAQAAIASKMTDHSLRTALTKPHVKAYYVRQLEVLRTSERARNIHTFVEVRDQTSNQMARVMAAKALEQLDDAQIGQSGLTHSPGITIRIVNHSHAEPVATPMIDVSPNDLAHD